MHRFSPYFARCTSPHFIRILTIKMVASISRCTYACHVALLALLTFAGYALAGPVSLGPLETWHFNGLQAKEVTLLNRKQLHIEDMYFTDEGPAVWFMVGKGDDYTQEFANLEGVIIPDEDSSCSRVKGYNFADITLTLPSDMKFTDYDYLSVFCVRFNHNFGYVAIPKGLKFDNETLAEEAKLKVPDTCPQDVEGRIPADDEDSDEADDDDDDEDKKKKKQQNKNKNKDKAKTKTKSKDQDDDFDDYDF